MPAPPAKTKYPDPTTEGQRLLQVATRGKSLSTIARELSLQGGQRASVGHWLNGDKRPKPPNRAAMWDRYQIPIAAWDHHPHAAAANGNGNGHALATAHGHTGHSDTGAPPTTLQDCLAVLALLRVERNKPNLLASERIKLAESEGRLLALRMRLERDHERLEDRIVREHPAWKRLMRLMCEVLAKHPAALADMATALEERLDNA